MPPSAGVLDRLGVLVIADSFDNVEPLRAAGAVIVGVRAAPLALAYAERHTIDVVLVDLRGADWWATPEIRALRALSRAPVYALQEADDLIPDTAARIAGVFPKPVNLDTLVATLAALPRHRTR